MLEQYRRYLLQEVNIEEKYLPYYVRWVSDCVSFLKKERGKRLSNEEKQSFLEHLSERFEDRQVKQADYAIKLYNHFLLRKYRSLRPELKQNVLKKEISTP